MGHLTVFFARTAGHLTKDFQKSQMPGCLPQGGGGIIPVGIDSYIRVQMHGKLYAIC